MTLRGDKMTSAIAAGEQAPPGLAPLSRKDASSFMEAQFPVVRLSAEAYKERKAGAGQTLTALGSYWKGRKPLILVRAVVLGALLPASDDPAADLDIFLKLMAMDDGAFGRRFDGSASEFARLFPDRAETVATNQLRVWRADIALAELKKRAAIGARISSEDAGKLHADQQRIIKALLVFADSQCASTPAADAGEFARVFPYLADELTEYMGSSWRWRDDLDEDERRARIADAFASLPYAERLKHVRRPEECNQEDLLAPVWDSVNHHIGTDANSISDLIEQLGIARFGHRPRLADTFCGGGSIPFEAARMGCDVYASDLNPVACMLTWGAFNIVGASLETRAAIERAQKEVAAAVDEEIIRLGIEHDKNGNRAKAFLYCLETRCPKSEWMVPMLPSLVISKNHNVVAKLVPDHASMRYLIEVHAGVSREEMAEAEKGTVRDGRLVHPMNPERSGVAIKDIRGDYRDAERVNHNRLRLWTKSDFMPLPDDIFQERLYAIQWITKDSLNKKRQVTYFAAVTEDDLNRERQAEAIVHDNLTRWQDEGVVPDMPIEPGEETTRLYRERGWTHWHHLFAPRQLHLASLAGRLTRSQPSNYIGLANLLDRISKLCRLDAFGGNIGRDPKVQTTFYNQALNTLYNYAVRSSEYALPHMLIETNGQDLARESRVETLHAPEMVTPYDISVTDPPYADAVNYQEITEFFIAWLRKNPPLDFNRWTWDSRRDLAIKGKDETFRRGMVAAYAALAKRMPDSGVQSVMFTHQDVDVWADLGAIMWAAGLRVSAAWNVATETASALKEGNYVQGTICLVLRKRLREANARRMEIEEAVSQQLARLAALDEAWTAETLYTDGDLTLAAYTVALRVVTAYSTIDRQPLDRDLYRKLDKGERTMIRELVDYAAQVANGLLVPSEFPRDSWRDLGPSQRFYVRMLDMESKGTTKVADFQNFARSFAYGDYASLMASTAANAARLAGAADLKGRMLDGDGFPKTQLRQVLFAIWKTLDGPERDPKRGVTILKTEYAADYWQRRQKLIGLAEYVAAKTKHTRPDESAAAHELAEALKVDRV
jgi:putative DNA methylase